MSLLGWSFANPALLWGLLALPLLWLILRAIPPAPQRRRFPGVLLLLGLADKPPVAARTPWWLVALRALALAAAILGLAGPSRTPEGAEGARSQPLLIVIDGGWGMAQDWAAARAAALDALRQAGAQGRRVALADLTDTPPPAPSTLAWQSAEPLISRLSAMTTPAPHAPARWDEWARALPIQAGDSGFDTLWLSDGLAHQGGRAALALALRDAGRVNVVLPAAPIYALGPTALDGGAVTVNALRADAARLAEITVLAIGRDPAGREVEFARQSARFAPGAHRTGLRFDLQSQLRGRLVRFEIEGQRSAAALRLTDDSLKRRKVAIIAPPTAGEGLRLLSPVHYLSMALKPSSDLLLGSLADVLPSAPDTIILADIATLPQAEIDALQDYVQQGGTLLRFAGPRMAAATGRALNVAGFANASVQDDALLPVRLRAGERVTSGAMTWGQAKTLAPFAPTSPFAGLVAGPDITVQAQVLAEPGPEVQSATLAALQDGTPLVTRAKRGAGQIVLFHTTANAEWTNLPLSGLFVQMLERLAVASPTAAAVTQDQIAPHSWQAERLLNGFGLAAAPSSRAVASGDQMWRGVTEGPSAALPPGLYAGPARNLALNVLPAGADLALFDWPEGISLRRIDQLASPAHAQGPLLALALLALALDILATLALMGRLRSGTAAAAAVLAGAMVLAGPIAQPLQAQDQTASDFAALRATREVVLAHVLTGDAALDQIAQAGLQGLGDVLTQRTSIEPGPPMGVNIETDDLEFYPFLYWPISPNQPLPSGAAMAKLNRFLRTGGMILLDTRTGDTATGPEADYLQVLALGLNIPPLEPIPDTHVLTRSFYLIQSFPGRYEGPPVWAEALPPETEAALDAPPESPPESAPQFRNQNDGVTPVIIGANDWAGAWAVDDFGAPLLPVGRGFAGEEQREYAYRFGVNVIMHALTGNYKSDQVHVPALLDRLGQ